MPIKRNSNQVKVDTQESYNQIYEFNKAQSSAQKPQLSEQKHQTKVIDWKPSRKYFIVLWLFKWIGNLFSCVTNFVEFVSFRLIRFNDFGWYNLKCYTILNRMQTKEMEDQSEQVSD